MQTRYHIRNASHPLDFKNYDTQRLRSEFLVKDLFAKDCITLIYSEYDRFIVGGVYPDSKSVQLETIDPLKSSFFLERRELGIINIGGKAIIKADGEVFELGYKEALYIGRGKQEVIFESVDLSAPAKLYLNSAPAHLGYPTKKVTIAEADSFEAGSLEASNVRHINRLIINTIVKTCQIQMGLTEFQPR